MRAVVAVVAVSAGRDDGGTNGSRSVADGPNVQRARHPVHGKQRSAAVLPCDYPPAS